MKVGLEFKLDAVFEASTSSDATSGDLAEICYIIALEIGTDLNGNCQIQ